MKLTGIILITSASSAAALAPGNTMVVVARDAAACAPVTAAASAYDSHRRRLLSSDYGWATHDISTAAGSAGSVFGIELDGDGHVDVLSASYLDNTIAWSDVSIYIQKQKVGPSYIYQ